MNIVITGAAGFIGSHLCERLTNEGHEVLGLDNLTPYYSPELKTHNVRQIEKVGTDFKMLDLAQAKLEPHLETAEYVFHLAGQPGLSSEVSLETYSRNNISATHRLLEALKNSSALKGFINVATSSIYGQDASGDETSEPKPTSYYGVTKLAAEQLALARYRDEDFPACSLRLFSVYGPRERPEKLYPRLIHSILSGEPFPLYQGSAEHVRSYSYVEDIVDGLVMCMTEFERVNGEIINIGTNKTMTTGAGIAIVEELLGKKAKIALQPKRAGDQLRTSANIDKARDLLGYNPTTRPQEGLAQEVTWYKEEVFGQIDPYAASAS